MIDPVGSGREFQAEREIASLVEIRCLFQPPNELLIDREFSGESSTISLPVYLVSSSPFIVHPHSFCRLRQ